METEEPVVTDNVDNIEKEPSEKQMNEETPEEADSNQYVQDTSEEGKDLFLRISKFFGIRKRAPRETECQTRNNVIAIFCVTSITGKREPTVVNFAA